MRKFLLLLLFAGTFGFTQAQSVCNPDFIYVLAGLPGLWPNPQQGPLPDGDLNQSYSETITVIVPADTTIDVSQFGLPFGNVTVSINSLDITGINGLPTGLSHGCDQATCSWANSTNGCFKISGTPTQSGQFVVGVLTSMNVNVPNFGPLQTPAAPLNYDLFVASPATAVADLRAYGYAIETPAPSPTSGHSVLRYTTPVAATVQLEIHDITGRKVHGAQQAVPAGDHSFQLDAEQWTPGLYLCSLIVKGKRMTTKLIVE
jgi:hypothetical protein